MFIYSDEQLFHPASSRILGRYSPCLFFFGNMLLKSTFISYLYISAYRTMYMLKKT